MNLTAHTVRVVHCKGGKATIRGFHTTATDALARWMDTRKALGIRTGTLFCTLQGGPLHDQYVQNLLHRLGGCAGVDKRVHPRGPRHTFAVEFGGTPVTVISMLLGHSSTAVTSLYLGYLTNAQAAAALEGRQPASSGELKGSAELPDNGPSTDYSVRANMK